MIVIQFKWLRHTGGSALLVVGGGASNEPRRDEYVANNVRKIDFSAGLLSIDSH